MRYILLLTLVATAAVAQQLYPFAVDQDALRGAPDFSFLNHPITAVDRVFVRDGAFHVVGPDLTPNTSDDARVRFWGVNLAFGANFPAEADAPRVAKRLRRLGVNLVRLHHMDSSPDNNPANAGSLLTTGPYPTLNPIAVERLRRFIDAMRQEGIYVNLNLKVGYVFRPSVDGVPELSPFPTQSKPVHMIHPRLIELQTEYTRKVIDALALKDDPALAMVEINNESSIIYHWQTSQLEPYLKGEYRDIFHQKWNDFLVAKYDSSDALREAWGATEPDGSDMLLYDWRVENGGRVPLSMNVDGSSMRLEAPASSTTVIIKQVGFSVDEGRSYIAEIEMRADVPEGVSRPVLWDVKQDVSPWRTATGQTVSVTSNWQKFRMVVTPQFAMDKIGRFAISIERVGAPLYVRGWRLSTGGKRGLDTSESLEARNLSLPSSTEVSTTGRTNDYLLYMVDRDRAYLNTMLRAVRESTDHLVPVTGSQVGFGGVLNYDSHGGLDYQDNHYYVDHYNFPNVAWDGRDWRFRDTSNIGGGATAFLNMAATRQAGRPFTVSELNQPWPNTYAAETDVPLAVFAAFQGWDALMHFAYSHGRGWDDGVPNGFNLNGDWTKWVNFGQSAWLFRSGVIREGLMPVEVPLSQEARLRAGRERRNGAVAGFLSGVYGLDPAVAFQHPVRIAAVRESETFEPRSAGKGPYASDTGEFTYDMEGRVWTIHAAHAAGVYGFVGRRRITAGAIDFELGASARGFVSLLLNALDGKPLEESTRMLLTNPGFSLRTQPGVSTSRPQAIVKYPGTTDWFTLEPDTRQAKPSGDLNGGSRPTYMERVDGTLTLRTLASSLRVHVLNGKGERVSTVDAERVDGGFRFSLASDTPWYEIEAER
ncbi:MAG: hypothetical protein SGI92_19455 [Bryobacteraceae bacterium]|nr:hypothetical protein [Bryobacteraceae bacterium]